MAVHHTVNARLRDNVQVTTTDGAVSIDLAAARSVNRIAILHDERPQALTSQYVNPARSAARAAALGEQKLLAQTIETYYRDLASGLQAGPKPASALAAENNYLQARGIVG